MSKMWGKYRTKVPSSRRIGGALFRIIAGLILPVAFVGLFATPGMAELPSPNFLPGFPMLAGNQVMLMWVPVPGAKEYNVYKNGKLLSTVPATQFFESISEETTGEFKYQVSAVAVDGTEGGRSPEQILSIVKLQAPKGLVGRVLSGSAALRWGSVEGAQLYNIYRAGKEDPGKFNLIGSVTADSYRDSTIEMGKAYIYKVSAKDLTGKESPLSDPLEMIYEEPKKAGKEAVVKARRTRTVGVLKPGLELQSGQKVDLRAPFDVAVAEDRIFVSHTGVHRVSAFEKNGRFLFSLNDKGKLAGDDQSKGFGRVAGVRLNPQKDTLYVMDGQAMKVFVYTLDGKLVKSISPQLPKPPEKELVFYSLEVDGDGNIWIPDARNNKVRIFNPQGKEIRTFGKEGELFAPGFSTIDGKNDRFYVVNTRKDKVGISVFALDGKFIRFFGEKGVGPGKFWAPGGIDVMEDGSIVEADAINSYINVFDPETGRLKYHFLAEDGKDIVQIASARGIRVTGDRLYVCSSIINEVDVLEMFGDIFEVK